MNRRHFLTVMGGAAATSTLFKSNSVWAADTTSFFAKGLVMVSFEDPYVLRLGFPKAPGHKATMAVLSPDGNRQLMNIKGQWKLESNAMPVAMPKIVIPELIRMKEFYGDAIRSTISQCPTVISIPYAAIRSIKAHELSESRYTFLRADTREEVTSFRPRRIAESLKIDLSSDSILRAEGGKTAITVGTARELHVEHIPEADMASSSGDMFADHFHHYFHYLERPAAVDFDVVPKKLSTASSTTPRVGNNFMFWPFDFCYMVAIP